MDKSTAASTVKQAFPQDGLEGNPLDVNQLDGKVLGTGNKRFSGTRAAPQKKLRKLAAHLTLSLRMNWQSLDTNSFRSSCPVVSPFSF